MFEIIHQTICYEKKVYWKIAVLSLISYYFIAISIPKILLQWNGHNFIICWIHCKLYFSSNTWNFYNRKGKYFTKMSQ
jgi:hypothetical protein